MTIPTHVLEAAGYDARKGAPPAQQREIQNLLKTAAGDPSALVAEILRLRRDLAHAKTQCATAAKAATRLEGILKGLLEPPGAMYRLEKLCSENGGPPRAIVRINGQPRRLAIHPDCDVERLERLMPWDYVCVHPTEMVVTGSWSDPWLFDHSQGDIVDFKGYRAKDQGLARVARVGREEEVVALAPPLREEDLPIDAKLVLLRDNPHWAIARMPAQRPESKFEVPLDQIHTRFEDLAGLDDVIQPIVEDLLIRLVYGEIRDEFALEPLRGLLLYSYKAGMGKTALARAFAVWLRDLGEQRDFDVALYVVKPNELKSMWHGEDARLVRDELCGSIRARQRLPRSRPLFQLVVLDEIDSLGRRTGGNDVTGYTSPAQNDAVQALLVEMDGMIQTLNDDPDVHVLWCGLTNRPDLVDPALKRPGRLGDLMLEMPDIDLNAGEEIAAVYARHSTPWYVEGEIHSDLDEGDLRRRLLTPALAQVFPMVVLRYTTDTRRTIDVSAGELLAGVHYKHAVLGARRRAAVRCLKGVGVPACSVEDLIEGLLEQAITEAQSMVADRRKFLEQLRIKVPVVDVQVVAFEELTAHRYLRSH